MLEKDARKDPGYKTIRQCFTGDCLTKEVQTMYIVFHDI